MRSCITCGSPLVRKVYPASRETLGRFRARKSCGPACQAKPVLPATERFALLWLPEPNSGCWLWLGSTDEDGYGRFRYERRSGHAHRASWALASGGRMPRLQVLHRCDTPCCVNPDHLFLGTPKANAADKVAKGRQARGAEHGARTAAGMRNQLRRQARNGVAA